MPEVRLKQWKRIDGKIRKIETNETGHEVVTLLRNKIEKNQCLVHVYNIFRQFKELKELKNNLKSDEAVVTVDFARNYDNKQASEV